MSTPHVAIVAEAHVGLRLDKFLSLALPDISRARIQNLIEGGAVRLEKPSPLGGREGGMGGHDSRSALTETPLPNPPRKGEGMTELASRSITSSTHKVRLGETYHLIEPETVALNLTPSNIALDVVYEDEHLLIINKPAGMTVHPAAGTKEDTLVHALLSHCGASLSGIGGVARPGIVHRIDKETSGLLAVAKNDAAHQSLSAQLKERTLKRTYLAFAWGGLNPRAGSVEAPLARHPRHRRQMAVVEGGRYALTHYTTLATFHAPGSITPLASKIECQLDTGRTHQIRVHMMHAKCPLLGDPVYGATTTTRLNRRRAGGTNVPDAVAAALQMLNRQALHAAQLQLSHPKSGEFMAFECNLAEDLQTLENALTTLTFSP